VTEPSGFTIPEYLADDITKMAAWIPISRELLDDPTPNPALHVPLHKRARTRLRASWWSWRTRVGEWVAGRTFTCDCED
jgi:hypothetical protein